MSMSKDELFEIFREYASEEFADIPSSDDKVDCEFSEKFERKMSELIDRISKDKKPLHINRKRIITVLIAAILVIAGVMSVGAVRKAVKDFIYEKINGNYEITFDGEAPDKLDYRYSFSVIPEGFVETERLSVEAEESVRYDNPQNNHSITLRQSAIGSMSSISMDGEHGHIEKYELDGTEISVYVDDQDYAYIAYWIWEYSFVELAYYGEATVDEVLELIKTIS